MAQRTIPAHLTVRKTYYQKAQILHLSNGEYWVFNSREGNYISHRSYNEAVTTRTNLLQRRARIQRGVDYPSVW